MKPSFEHYIQTVTQNQPSRAYNLPTSSGYLNIAEGDEETFKSLYNVHPSKGIGHSEVAIHWLFASSSFTNHGRDNADLIISGSLCEIKSYPNHFVKMPLGKFKDDRCSRYILNNLFSFYNLSQSSSFYSETSFNIDTISASYDAVLNSSRLIFYDKEHYHGDILYNKALELLSLVTGSNVEELSKNLLIQIIETKLNKKPGHEGYIINVTPKDPTNIYTYKIDTTKLQYLSYEELRDNVNISSGELYLNFKIFNDKVS